MTMDLLISGFKNKRYPLFLSLLIIIQCFLIIENFSLNRSFFTNSPPRIKITSESVNYCIIDNLLYPMYNTSKIIDSVLYQNVFYAIIMTNNNNGSLALLSIILTDDYTEISNLKVIDLIIPSYFSGLTTNGTHFWCLTHRYLERYDSQIEFNNISFYPNIFSLVGFNSTGGLFLNHTFPIDTLYTEELINSLTPIKDHFDHPSNDFIIPRKVIYLNESLSIFWSHGSYLTSISVYNVHDLHLKYIMGLANIIDSDTQFWRVYISSITLDPSNKFWVKLSHYDKTKIEILGYYRVILNFTTLENELYLFNYENEDWGNLTDQSFINGTYSDLLLTRSDGSKLWLASLSENFHVGYNQTIIRYLEGTYGTNYNLFAIYSFKTKSFPYPYDWMPLLFPSIVIISIILLVLYAGSRKNP